MIHKTLIGGTAYEIIGGKTLVKGTAYKIKNGKTLVGGTAYDVGFVKMVKIRIVGRAALGDLSFNKDEARVTVESDIYDGSENVTLVVPAGTFIDIHTSNLFINNELIIDRMTSDYTYIAQKDVTIGLGMSTFITTTSYVYIYDKNPRVFFVGALHYYYNEDSIWSDVIIVNDSSDAHISIANEQVFLVKTLNGNQITSKLKLNGVDIKPTDKVIWGATYNPE